MSAAGGGGRRRGAEGADAGEPGPEGAALSPDTVSSPLPGHAHLTDFNIATIIKDGERATALAGTKPYMGECGPRPAQARPAAGSRSPWPLGPGPRPGGTVWVIGTAVLDPREDRVTRAAAGHVETAMLRRLWAVGGEGARGGWLAGPALGHTWGRSVPLSFLESSGDLPVFRQWGDRLLFRGGLVVGGGDGLRAAAWLGM